MPAKNNKVKKTKSTFVGIGVTNKSKNLGLTKTEYELRAKINNEKKKYATNWVKGLAGKKKPDNLMSRAWIEAGTHIKKKYGDKVDLKKLGVTIKTKI